MYGWGVTTHLNSAAINYSDTWGDSKTVGNSYTE